MNCPVRRIRRPRILPGILALIATLVSGCGSNQVTLAPAPLEPLYHGAPWKSVALGYRSGNIASAVAGAANKVWFADGSQSPYDPSETILGSITTSGATAQYYPFDDSDTLLVDLQAGPNDSTYYLEDAFGYGIATGAGALTQYQTECSFDDCRHWRNGLHAPASQEMAVTADGAAWLGGDDKPPLPFSAYLVRANGSVDTLLSLPSALSGRVPNDFTIGPDGNPWFTSAGTSVIGRVDRANDQISTFAISTSLNPDRAYAEDLVTGPDGNVWVYLCGKAEGKLVRVTPAGSMTAFDLPSALSAACVETSHGLIAGVGQAIWSVTGAKSVMHLSTATGQPVTYNIYPTPNAAGPVQTIALGADKNIWAFLASSQFAYVFTPRYEISTQPSSENLKVNRSATVTVAESEYEGTFNGASEACATVTRFGSTDSFAVTGKTPGSCFVHFADTIGFATAYVHVVVSN